MALRVDLKAEQCPVCGGTKLESALLTASQQAAQQNVPRDLPYEQCAQCGLWVQSPTGPVRYESDDKDRKTEILEEAGHYEWLANRLYKDHRPGSVLDIAPGYPLFLSLMKKNGVRDVQSLDGSKLASDFSIELSIPTVQDGLEHNFRDRKFDLIVVNHFLGHYAEPVVAVLKLKKWLNPNGVIFVRTPLNDTTGLTRWHLTKSHFKYNQVIFGQRSIKVLFEAAGMVNIYEAVGDGVGHGDYEFRTR